MATFAATYAYASGKEAERDTHRSEHKDFLAGLHADGILRVSGPLDGGNRALLVLEGSSSEEVASLLDRDPFHRHGLIGERTIAEWSIVFGSLR